MEEKEKQEAGLKAQVEWCVEAVQKIIQHLGLKIQDPPPTKPPTNP